MKEEWYETETALEEIKKTTNHIKHIIKEGLHGSEKNCEINQTYDTVIEDKIN